MDIGPNTSGPCRLSGEHGRNASVHAAFIPPSAFVAAVDNSGAHMRKFMLTAIAGIALALAASLPAAAAPVVNGQAIQNAIETMSPIESVRHRRWHRRHYYRSHRPYRHRYYYWR